MGFKVVRRSKNLSRFSAESVNNACKMCVCDAIQIDFPMSATKTEFPESVEVKPSWQIELLYDGECPLCVREVNFLKKQDAGRGFVSFVDIAEDGYNPEAHGGIDCETAMGRIHAVLPDGTTVKNVEVFRRIYEILGMGWILSATERVSNAFSLYYPIFYHSSSKVAALSLPSPLLLPTFSL